MTTTAHSYNSFCFELDALGIEVDEVKHSANGLRHGFYYEGQMVAYLDERKDHGIIY